MAAIILALLLGGLAGAALLWPYGWGYALIGAPLGASALALIVSLLRFAFRPRSKSSSARKVRTG